MKFNSMDAVNTRIGSVQTKVGQSADGSQDGVVYANNVEKAAGSGQPTYSTVNIASQDNGKKHHVHESDYNKVLQEAVEKVNKVISSDNRKFEITIHEKTKDILIKVIDTDTNETIKEIPPKKIVDLVVSLCELAGIIFDAKG